MENQSGQNLGAAAMQVEPNWPTTLIRVGGWVVNLRYLILAEETKTPDPKGRIEATFETGRLIVFQGDDAEAFRLKLLGALGDTERPAFSVGRPVRIEPDRDE